MTHAGRPPHPPIPPEVSGPASRLAESVVRPIERFLHVEAASGIVLLAVALAALAWANSPWRDLYDRVWQSPITFGVGAYSLSHSLRFWINDGLMVLFFFAVGLEIRRELHDGELSDPRRAALPVVAAAGGILVPALIYLALNPSPPERHGWGVPMATDIAFAVGVLALLGRRVPAPLRILLLAVAIIDDVAAILVIALFYSTGVAWAGLALATGGIFLVLGLQKVGVRLPLIYVLPGLIIWAGLLWGGIHPTIAGVVLGLLTPARPWFGTRGFLSVAEDVIQRVRLHADRGRAGHRMLRPLSDLDQASREALAPAVRLEAMLHPWVAFVIMPLFALANAGVNVGSVNLASAAWPVMGIVLGLVIGKPVGIILASFVASRVGIVAVPPGVTWKAISVLGCVAGIGFTMAIFIAGLAFDDPRRLGAATFAVLVASAIAALMGLGAGRLLLPLPPGGPDSGLG